MNAVTAEAANPPLAVTRALRQASVHLSVRRAEIVATHIGEWIVEIDIYTAMPAQWRAAGVSPAGVRLIETVRVRFDAHFPLSSPLVELRDDFDRSHPHLNPGPKDAPPQPCLIAGSVRELVQTRGFIGLVDRLVDWLEKASSLTLNDRLTGWEPVRRDHIDDFIVVNSHELHALTARTDGSVYLWTQFVVQGAEPRLYRIHCPVNPAMFGPRGPSRFDRQPFASDIEQGMGLTIAAWAPKKGKRWHTVGQYRPEDVDTVGALLERAREYGCLRPLKQKLDHVAARLDADPLAISIPIAILLLPRRPYNLVGTASPVETCGYLIEVSRGADIRNLSTPVRLLAHRDPVSAPLLRRTSGDDPVSAINDWTLLGCGSVGSKLALHMARTARPPSVLVDNDRIEPHNFARHAALPIDPEREGIWWQNKVDVVTEMMAQLGFDGSVPLRMDAMQSLVNSAARSALAPPGCRMIVNTTGSAALREGFAHTEWDDRPPMIEACLLGAGAAAMLLAEGAALNPTTSDLMAELYNDLRDEPALAAKVFGAGAEAIAIGQGCSAVSFAMSDAKLSALTASMAGRLAAIDAVAPPENGMLFVGRVGEDGITQQWKQRDVLPWIVIPGDSTGAPSVRLSSRVHRKIAEEVARHARTETGGVLIGRFSQIGNCFQVVDLLPAPPDSKRSAHEFSLGTEGLPVAIKQIQAQTRGALHVLGTWHSHLLPSGPSTTDIATGAMLAMAQVGPLLMLIHTPDGYRALTVEATGDSNVGKGERE